MINNRQAGRRRGRGGQRQQGGSPGRGPESGNRIDNRARGNAAQLLEKYKNLARDAQMQGDRVNIEYYLQFADHYFRVLADSRSRFEENNPQARRQQGEGNAQDDFDDDFGGDEATTEADRREAMNDRVDGRLSGDDRNDNRGNEARGNDNRGNTNGYDRQRDDRPQRDDRSRDARPPREPREQQRQPAYEQQAEAPQGEDQADRPRRGRPPRERIERDGNQPAETDRLPLSMLPPAIQMGMEGEPATDDEAPAAPRRRGRPRKSEGTAEAAE